MSVAAVASYRLPTRQEDFDPLAWHAWLRKTFASDAAALIVRCEAMPIPNSSIAAHLLVAYRQCLERGIVFALCGVGERFKVIMRSLCMDKVVAEIGACPLAARGLGCVCAGAEAAEPCAKGSA